MSAAPPAPDTIVLIHGFWVTPRSWEHWITHYESKGYRVLAPATRASRSRSRPSTPTPPRSRTLTVPAIVEHLESVIGELDTPPILMGHSAGGAFTQILLDHGFGAAGVAIELGADRGRPGRAAVAAQVDVPGAQEPGNRHQRRRLHPRAVALRVHQHASPRRSRARCTSATTIPASGGDPVGQRARQRPARPPGHAGSTTTTTTARRCCSSPAARTTSCRRRSSSPTPSTTSPNTVTEIKEFEGSRTCCRRRRAGRRSPTTRSTGR